MLRAAEAAAQADAGNFARRLGVKSYRAHVDQLRTELRLRKYERAVEVLKVRLKGRRVQGGSIRLPLLARLTAQLGDAIHAGAQKIASGRRVRRISPEIVSRLDLRLSGLTSGSTNLVITGQIEPDLFGASLLEDSFEELFGLLNADIERELADHVAGIGIRAAHEVRSLLKTLDAAELEADFIWRTAAEDMRVWTGTRHKIGMLSSVLSNFRVVEPETLHVTATTVTVSLRRPIELEVEGGVITATVPLRLLERIQELHVGQGVVATILRNIVVNAVTGTERIDHVLLDISPSGSKTGIEA